MGRRTEGEGSKGGIGNKGVGGRGKITQRRRVRGGALRKGNPRAQVRKTIPEGPGKHARRTYKMYLLRPKRTFRLTSDDEPSGSRLRTVTYGICLVILVLAPVVAQETGGKPDTPTLKVGQGAIVLTPRPTTATSIAKSALGSETPRGLQELAAEILKYAAVPGCEKTKCAILV